MRGRLRNSSRMISCQRSSTSLTLVKKRWPPRSKRYLPPGPSRTSVLAMPPTWSSASKTITGQALLGQQVAGGQARGPAPEDQGGLVLAGPGWRARRAVVWWLSLISSSSRGSSCRARRAPRSAWPGGRTPAPRLVTGEAPVRLQRLPPLGGPTADQLRPRRVPVVDARGDRVHEQHASRRGSLSSSGVRFFVGRRVLELVLHVAPVHHALASCTSPSWVASVRSLRRW